MEKKNIIIATVAISIGILLGYLFFGSSTNEQTTTHSEDDGHNHSQNNVNSNKETIWTCSMHPQIRRNEPGNCPICGMTLIPLDEISNDNPLIVEMSTEAVKLSNIQTTIVGSDQNNLAGVLSLTGKIKANETTTASIVSHIPGRIEKLYVSFTGDQIYQGQKIATIYSPNLITAQKELLEAYKHKDVNPSLFNATKNKLKFWKITDQQIDDILKENKLKEYFDIYADHSGIVKERKVSVGDHLMEGGVLFEIQDLNKLWVEFDVYESELSKIKIGEQISFTTPALLNKTFKAPVTFIDPFINPQTRVANVRVEINNSKHLLKPEMFVNGKIEAHTNNNLNKQLVMVPKSAVLWTGERSVVYVKVPNIDIPSFEYKEVVIGESKGNQYVILSGLQPGEEIVTNGAFVIDAAAQLNNQNSMMNKLVEVKPENNSANDEQMKCDGSMKMDDNQMSTKNNDDSEMKCEPGKCGK